MFNLKETKSEKFYYNKLYYDFIFDFKSVSRYFFYDFHKTRDFKRRSEDITDYYNNDRRTVLVEILEKSNLKLGCSNKVIDNIRKLRSRDTFVIVGGQQPGLFTGPVFIIYKILSIIKLSNHIAQKLKIDTVPVFWNASDDSNFSQINNLFVIDSALKKIELQPDDAFSDIVQKRFSDILLPENTFIDVLNRLTEEIKETDFSDSIYSFLRESLGIAVTGEKKEKRLINPSNLFSVIISRLFSKYGLIILEPSIPEIKKLIFDSVLFDIKKSRMIEDAVNKTGRELLSSGYHQQLHIEKKSLNFFIVKNGLRHKLYRKDEKSFLAEGIKYNRHELEELVFKEPGIFSPNVVLRPIFQDSVLPVLANVCGPGEISYFAQLKDVYEIAGIKTGILFPRFSATMVENKISSSINKIGLEIEELDLDKEIILKKIVSKGMDELINSMTEEFESEIAIRLSKLKNRIQSKGLDVSSAFNRIENNLKKESLVLRNKIFSELKRKNVFLISNIDKIYSNLFPDGNLQERVVNIFQFINKYNFCLIDLIYDNIDPENSLHRFIIFNKS